MNDFLFTFPPSYPARFLSLCSALKLRRSHVAHAHAHAHRGYVELVSGQVAKSISSARTYEEEKKRAEALAELDRAKTAFFR